MDVGVFTHGIKRPRLPRPCLGCKWNNKTETSYFASFVGWNDLESWQLRASQLHTPQEQSPLLIVQHRWKRLGKGNSSGIEPVLCNQKSLPLLLTCMCIPLILPMVPSLLLSHFLFPTATYLWLQSQPTSLEGSFPGSALPHVSAYHHGKCTWRWSCKFCWWQVRGSRLAPYSPCWQVATTTWSWNRIHFKSSCCSYGL